MDVFGAELRRRRMAAEKSLNTLAKEIHYSKGYLSRIETGQKPAHPDLARACDAALDAHGELARLVIPRPRTRDRKPPMSRAERPARLDTPGPDIAAAIAHLRDDPMAIGAFEQQFAHFRQLGSSIGADLVDAPVRYYARILADSAMLSSGEHRARLLTLAARYAEYAGWMRQESGVDRDALDWTSLAVALADANGEPLMAVHALLRRALIALYGNEPARVIELATDATRSPVAPPWLRGLAYQRKAQGHAIDGDYDEVSRALDHAARLVGPYEHAGTPMQLGSIAVADPLAMTRGWCLSDLGRPGAAAEILAPEVARIPRHARRSRARFGMRLALAHALDGEIDQACVTAHEVVPDALAIRSATVARDVGRLSRTVGRWRGHEPVKQLLPRLAAVMGSSPSTL